MKAVFLDLVGTLVKGKSMKPFDGAVEKFNLLKSRTRVCIITNNTTDTPDDLRKKLLKEGFDLDGVVLLSPLTVLRELLKGLKGRIYYIGSEAVFSIIREVGKEISEDAEIVVVGLDLSLTYEKLTKATNLILSGAEFIGLHSNRLFLMEPGKIGPSVGATIAFLEYATSKKARIVGKPEKEFFRTGLSLLGVKPEDVVVVGDDPISEVSAPQALGMKAIFVRSGKYKECPDFVSPYRVYENFTDIEWENL